MSLQNGLVTVFLTLTNLGFINSFHQQSFATSTRRLWSSIPEDNISLETTIIQPNDVESVTVRNKDVLRGVESLISKFQDEAPLVELPGYKDSGWVDIVVTRVLDDPLVTPTQAREAWLDFVWKQGGGLATFVLPNEEGTKRLLLPTLMEETLVRPRRNNTSASTAYNKIQYKVSKFGFLQDLEPNTHLGTVTFNYDTKSKILNPEISQVTMTWKATFFAHQRKKLWQEVAQSLISNAANNLQAYLATPFLLTHETTIRLEPNTYSKLTNKHSKDGLAAVAALEWIDYVWRKGGNLPLPSLWPIMWNRTETENVVRWIVPPFIKQRLMSVNQMKDGTSEITYQVENPSLFTYPVHTHTARIKFTPTGDNMVTMKWQVQIRPYGNPAMAIVAKSFTEFVVTTLARNYALQVGGSIYQASMGVWSNGYIVPKDLKATMLAKLDEEGISGGPKIFSSRFAHVNERTKQRKRQQIEALAEWE